MRIENKKRVVICISPKITNDMHPYKELYLNFENDFVFRFMTHHVRELYNHVLHLTTPNKRRAWDTICDRVQNQIFLRMVTCCQLASKLTSHYKVRLYVCRLGWRWVSNEMSQFGHSTAK